MNKYNRQRKRRDVLEIGDIPLLFRCGSMIILKKPKYIDAIVSWETIEKNHDYVIIKFRQIIIIAPIKVFITDSPNTAIQIRKMPKWTK